MGPEWGLRPSESCILEVLKPLTINPCLFVLNHGLRPLRIRGWGRGKLCVEPDAMETTSFLLESTDGALGFYTYCENSNQLVETEGSRDLTGTQQSPLRCFPRAVRGPGHRDGDSERSPCHVSCVCNSSGTKMRSSKEGCL